jgi:hypothetical protein
MITPEIIRDAKPCATSWKKFMALWGDRPMNMELSIGDVLITNGLQDALWCLRFVTAKERIAAILPTVKRVSAFTTDARAHARIDALERFVATGNAEGLRGVVDAVYADAEAARADSSATYKDATDVADTFSVDAAHAAVYAAAHAFYAIDDAHAVAYAADAAACVFGAAANASPRYLGSDLGYAAAHAERQAQKADLLERFPPLVFGDSKCSR